MNTNPQREAHREAQIERYLNGAMSSDERRGFLDGAERDPLLKRQIQAEQLIDRAVSHDRAAIGGPSAGARSQFLSMLATVTAEDTPAPPSTPSSPADGGSSPLRYLPGTGRTRGIIAAIAGAALIVGAIVIGPRLTSSRPAGTDAAPTPAQMSTAPPARQAPPQAIESAPAADPAVTGPAAGNEAVPASQPATGEPANLQPTSSGRPTETASRNAAASERGARPASRETRNQTPTRSSAPSATAAKPTGTPAKVPTVNDEARGNVGLKDPTVTPP